MNPIRVLKLVAPLLAVALVCSSPAALAQAKAPAKPPVAAKVDKLQLPAWVERGGVKASIKAGWAIYAGDRVFTGETGRISLTVVGDARLKLGGSADVSFTDVRGSADESSLLKVNRGAFHFTAPVIGRPEGTLLMLGKGTGVSVLGGQVWGRSDPEQDLLVLLDGSADITSAKGKPVRMNKPETVVVAPRNGKLQPVIPVARERLAQWLGQTQPVAGQPSLVANGLWDVSLGSGYNLKELEEQACRVQSRGFPAEIYPVREPGKQVWYRVVVRRFETRDDAIDFAKTGKAYGAEDAWVLLPQS